LLLLFAGLMIVIAVRMWQTSDHRRRRADPPGVRALPRSSGPSCQRTEQGHLPLTSRCVALLVAAGLGSGFLAGMFGVGGGFIIVPALVLLTAMPIRRAVATSLLVIVLVSASGVVAHVAAGSGISLATIGPFALGGVLGMAAAATLVERLSAATLQKTFAVGIVGVAAMVIGKALT
jgi:uncharacterized membrane protein YfcA